jgi:hypothetical protein
MRSRDRVAGPFAGAHFGLKRAVVGIGPRVRPAPASLDEAILSVSSQSSEKAGRGLVRFAELPTGAFVWTRAGEDEYRLGKVRGDWFYDDSREAREVGLYHFRPCSWMEESFKTSFVPSGVLQTFLRGGLNFQRIRNQGVESESQDLWHDPELPSEGAAVYRS